MPPLHNIMRLLRDAKLPAASADAVKMLNVPLLGYLLGYGNTVPSDADTGWAKGAIFIHADGTTGALLYVNIGDTDSCDFDALDETTLEADLASVATGKGAAKVGVEDAAGYFTATTVEAALAEIIADLAATTATNGANKVGYEDAGTLTAAATVDAALDEIYAHLLAKRSVSVPLVLLRETSSDDIQAAAAHGGILSKDSTPILEHASGDTDSQLRVNWASSNSDPVMFQVDLPDDLDDTKDIELILRAEMGGATDTPAIDADTFFDEGDTKVSDASAALADAVADVLLTIAAADIPTGARVMSVELTPGAHTTDAIYLYGIKMRYSPKLIS